MKMTEKFILASILLNCASIAFGANLQFDDSGAVAGATGISVNGSYYTVQFQIGSCNSLYSGCNSSLLPFADNNEALTATQQLFNQVIARDINNLAPVSGCTEGRYCHIHAAPYALASWPEGVTEWGITYYPGSASGYNLEVQWYSRALTFNDLGVYAVWSPEPAPSVPLPASAWLFLSSLCGLIKRKSWTTFIVR